MALWFLGFFSDIVCPCLFVLSFADIINSWLLGIDVKQFDCLPCPSWETFCFDRVVNDTIDPFLSLSKKLNQHLSKNYHLHKYFFTSSLLFKSIFVDGCWFANSYSISTYCPFLPRSNHFMFTNISHKNKTSFNLEYRNNYTPLF